MAYPFAQAPTFAEFCKALTENYGCVLKSSRGLVAKSNGDPPEHVQFIERIVDGKAVQCAVVPDSNPQARMVFSVIRSICARLGVDPAFFGLTLG